MNHFDLAQSFIECCERSDPIDQLAAAFQTALEQLGFGYFACCSHVDPLNPPPSAVMLHNYPAVWVRTFSESKLYEIDPVLLQAERTPFAFFWNDCAFRAQLTGAQTEILAAAGSLGIQRGYTIPIHLSWVPGSLRASCSLVPNAKSIDASSYAVAQLLATHFYAAATRAYHPWNTVTPIVLSPRERQCLELAAQGKSDWVIGRVLGLNKGTAHKYMENVKRRLGVATRVQAIVKALMTRQISFGDVVHIDPEKSARPIPDGCTRSARGPPRSDESIRANR